MGDIIEHLAKIYQTEYDSVRDIFFITPLPLFRLGRPSKGARMSTSTHRPSWRNPSEVDRLKASADLVGLVRAHGVELKSEGSDLVGLCPFHREETPSFRVTPSKNLYHCFGCGKGGSAVDWLVAMRGLSLREAFEELRSQSPALTLTPAEETEPAAACPEPSRRAPSLSREIDSPISVDSSVEPASEATCAPLITCKSAEFWANGESTSQDLLWATVEHYQTSLAKSEVCKEYLASRGLWDEALVRRFHLGYADRSLGVSIPDKQVRWGAQVRENLQGLGVLRESGHEHLNGSLVVPILGGSVSGQWSARGQREVLGMYGRKVGKRFRTGTPLHLYLKGEHRGVFNAAGVRSSGSTTVVLCEALLDALTLIRWGIEPVTSAYGVHGVTKELWHFLTTTGFTRVVIAFDSDESGDRAASELALRLAREGLEVQRLRLPAGHDVNSFAVASEDPASALRQALDCAVWASERLYEASTPLAELQAEGPTAQRHLPLAAEAPAVAAEVAPPAVALRDASGSSGRTAVSVSESGLPAKPDDSLPPVPLAESIEGDSGTYEASFGDRSWRVKGLLRNRSDDVLRVTLRVSRQAHGQAGFHLDTLDLYVAKSREAFARAASAELGIDLDVVRADLARLVVALEERQKVLFAGTREPPPVPVRTLTTQERDEALALLRRPDMLRQLLTDLDTSGMVGEEENKLLCWFSLTSRHLDNPLGVLIQSSSAAGKSSLLDGVLRTMPEESIVRYSAMSGQALFYMGGVSLKHKILCVAEEEGARRASYSLKLLQSDGELSMASTGKDPESGQLVTKEYKTEGPVALAMTTTSLDVDPELQNRCLVLSVDESREQTEAIHHVQRLGRTRFGVSDRRVVSERLLVWRNVQRLLRPVAVVNPFAQELTFASHQTRTRRDMAKYLTLVEAVALAHQYQKEHHRDEHGEYIEVDLDDIELANRLAVRGLGLGLQDLSGSTRRVLDTLRCWVRERATSQGIDPSLVRFSRRDLLGHVPCGSTQLKMHLRALLEHEVVSVVRGKNGTSGSVQYCLESLDEGEYHAGMVGLLETKHLRWRHPSAKYHGTWSAEDASKEGTTPGRSVPGRHPVGYGNRPGHVVVGNGHQANGDGSFRVSEIVVDTANGDPVGPVGISHIRRKIPEPGVEPYFSPQVLAGELTGATP
jgi:DNA primase